MPQNSIFLEDLTSPLNVHKSSSFVLCSSFVHVCSSLCWFFLPTEGTIILLMSWAKTSVSNFHSAGWKHLSPFSLVRCRQPLPTPIPPLGRYTFMLEGQTQEGSSLSLMWPIQLIEALLPRLWYSDTLTFWTQNHSVKLQFERITMN